MPNAIVRATARTLPDVTSRRSVLGAVLAAGAVAVPALPFFAAVETPALSTPTAACLIFGTDGRRLRAALDRLSERIDVAEAQMPEWARSGPKYVLAKGEYDSGITHAAGDVGWPEVYSSPSALLDGSSSGRTSRTSTFGFRRTAALEAARMARTGPETLSCTSRG